ncbi:MAG: matrixin family metalloprotease [Mycobacteriales bacterium]|nr:matrixin family metalloprotease [Mycobacteriales bacterium]
MDDYFGAAPTPAPQAGQPWGTPAVQSGPPARRTRGWLVALVAAGALLAVGLVSLRDTAQSGQVSQLRAVTEPAPAVVGWTASYVDEAGRPARWDPCEPIRYVVQPQWMPQQGRRDLAEALRRISAVSGLRFVDEGDTEEVPSDGRAAYQSERYGQRWAPLLVGWVPAARTDLPIGDGTQGLAVAVAVPGTDAGGHLVTGQVVLDADHRLASGFGPGATEGEVLLHELTHVVGLGHVDDATQVMHVTTTNSESEFGRGDRAGLTALGAAAGCHPAPAARELQLG